MLSIVIPSRNEPYLLKTIKDLLINAKGQIEIIAILDGYWPRSDELSDDKRVSYIHYTEPRGMRNAINAGVALAKGEYILKCDAHCLFSPGYDLSLISSYENNTIIIPRRYALDPVNWVTIDNPKYPVDYMYLSKDLHGEVWTEKNNNHILDGRIIDETMSAQGSCWFMSKDYYHELELLDEAHYGTFWNEFQEIGLKCWLSGGRVLVKKDVFYAHWHKTGSRGYNLDRKEQEKAIQMVKEWSNPDKLMYYKQIHPLSWLIDRFKPVPTWN